MATYVALLRFTAQGVKNIKQSPSRAQAFRKAVAAGGGRVRHLFWTMGSHDGVAIFDMPNSEAATALMLSIALKGNVQTETLRAFEEQDFKEILKRVK